MLLLVVSKRCYCFCAKKKGRRPMNQSAIKWEIFFSFQLWNNHHLDKAVAQSQAFINECRRALGLSMKFWVAEIHEIVKNTILNYSEIRTKCAELNDALKQVNNITHICSTST